MLSATVNANQVDSNDIDMLFVTDFEGRFQHFDESGSLLFEDNHVIGNFDLSINYGFFHGAQRFNGEVWFADSLQMYLWEGEPGSGLPSYHTFSWVEHTWARPNEESITCTFVPNTFDECRDERTSEWLLLDKQRYTYEFELYETEFAGITAVDIGTERDIPVVSAMSVDAVDERGALILGSIDTDKDGIPGTRLLSSPYANQTISFNGAQIPASIKTILYEQEIGFTNASVSEVERFTVGDLTQIPQHRTGSRISQRGNDWQITVDAPGFYDKKVLLSASSKQGAVTKSRDFVDSLVRLRLSQGYSLAN
jgi:hypothetical protein